MTGISEELWMLVGLLRVILRVGLGGYFLLQGLNAWFNFFKIPQPLPALQKFLIEFAKVKGFLQGVKLAQVLLGLSLVFGLVVGLSLLGLGILIFGICLLQWQLNHNRKLVFYLAGLYLVTLLLHTREILNLLL